jgi:hypothetical protein
MELQAELQRLSGTTLDAQGAANVWAGTTGLDLVAALNVKAGTTGLGLNAALKAISGTTLDGNGSLVDYSDVVLTTVMRIGGGGGDTGPFFSTPDSAAASVTGDIDIRAKLKPLFWDGDGWDQQIIRKTGSYQMLITSDGAIKLLCTAAGGAANIESTAPIGLTNNTVGYVRATRVAATNVNTYYTSTNGSSWNQLGDVVDPATDWDGDIIDTANAVGVGDIANLNMIFADTDLYWVEVRNGIDGPVVVHFDPSAVEPSGVRTPGTFVSPTGETWTANAQAASTWDWAQV